MREITPVHPLRGPRSQLILVKSFEPRDLGIFCTTPQVSDDHQESFIPIKEQRKNKDWGFLVLQRLDVKGPSKQQPDSAVDLLFQHNRPYNFANTKCSLLPKHSCILNSLSGQVLSNSFGIPSVLVASLWQFNSADPNEILQQTILQRTLSE